MPINNCIVTANVQNKNWMTINHQHPEEVGDCTDICSLGQCHEAALLQCIRSQELLSVPTLSVQLFQ